MSQESPKKSEDGGESSEKSPRTITYEELKQHNTAKSLWMAIHDRVYDITKFLDQHPGGEEVLLETAGSYATDSFEDVGHSQDARDLMEDFFIGVLPEAEREAKSSKPKTTPQSPEAGGGSSMAGWLIPLGIAVVAAMVYRFIIAPSSS